MITDKEFSEGISKFDELEKRGSFYDMAVELMNNGFEREAYCLILVTWNFAVSVIFLFGAFSTRSLFVSCLDFVFKGLIIEI